MLTIIRSKSTIDDKGYDNNNNNDNNNNDNNNDSNGNDNTDRNIHICINACYCREYYTGLELKLEFYLTPTTIVKTPTLN